MAQVLAKISFPKDNCTVPLAVVLRQMDNGSFATHLKDDRPEMGENGGYFWGHYFNDSTKAMMDYRERRQEKLDVYLARGLQPLSDVGLAA